NALALWDVETGRIVRWGDSTGPRDAAATTPDGRLLVLGSDAEGVRVVEAATGEEVWSARQQGRFSALSRDGSLLATFAHSPPCFRVSARAGGKLLGVLPAPRTLSGPVAFLPAGKTLAAVHGPRVALWPLDGRPAPAWYDSPPSRLAFAGPDRLVTGSVDPHEPLTVWDTATGGPRRLLGQGYGSKELAVSPAGRLGALPRRAGPGGWETGEGRGL